jgi:hypothetical protein
VFAVFTYLRQVGMDILVGLFHMLKLVIGHISSESIQIVQRTITDFGGVGSISCSVREKKHFFL